MPKLQTLHELAQPGYFPFMLGLVFIVFAFLYRLLGLPPPVELSEIAGTMYAKYGLPVLLIAAYLEGLVVIGFYLPGSFVILLSVYLSSKTFSSLATIAATVAVALLLAAATNYLIGRYGFYRLLMRFQRQNSIERMTDWMTMRGRLALPLSAALPNFFAVAAVCMGIARNGLAVTLFRSALGLALWIPLCTFLASRLLPQVSLDNPNQHWWLFSGFVIWGLYLIAIARWRRAKAAVKTQPDNEAPPKRP